MARSDGASLIWRQQFTRTFLERDLPDLGVSLPAAALMRFFTMVAHYHGGVWSAADPARSGRRYGVEVKRQDAPRLTPSMRVALDDLKLARLTVVYPGPRRYALTDRVMVVPAVELATGKPEAVIAVPRSGRRRGSAPA